MGTKKVVSPVTASCTECHWLQARQSYNLSLKKYGGKTDRCRGVLIVMMVQQDRPARGHIISKFR